MDNLETVEQVKCENCGSYMDTIVHDSYFDETPTYICPFCDIIDGFC